MAQMMITNSAMIKAIGPPVAFVITPENLLKNFDRFDLLCFFI
jgi:hypothetical protein